MADKAWETVEREILNALTDPEFKFIQDTDELNVIVLLSLVSYSRKNSKIRMSMQMLRSLHEAMLVKEVVNGGSQENIERILSILTEIKNNASIIRYLKGVPASLEHHVVSNSKFKNKIVLCDKVEIEKKAKQLEHSINRFLEQ